jgi:hypothetical protein
MRFYFSMICLVLFACKPQNGPYDLKHDAAQYVASPDAWHWVELSPQEFEDIHIPSNGWGTKDAFLPASHAATKRMDYLLGKIHQRIQERYPEQLKNVPVPRSAIYKGESPDAFVTTVPVCYSIPVKLDGSASLKGDAASTDWIALDHNGNLSGADHNDLCVRRTMSQLEANKYFDWISRNIKRTARETGQTDKFCEIRVQSSYGGFQVIPNAHCRRAPELDGIMHAKGFVVWKTQPYIVLYRGILRHVDAEIKIMTTLAHELGHYYRSHLTAFAGDYDYFYQQDVERNPSQKPQRDPALQERGQEIRAAARLVQSYVYSEPEQIYPSELFYPVWALASRACPKASKEPCPEACTAFVELVNDDEVYASFGGWPYDSMPEAGHSSYKRYEAGLEMCADQLHFTDGETGGSKLSLDDLKEAFEDEEFDATLKAMGIGAVEEFKGKTLEQLLEKLEQGLGEAKVKAQETIRKANADGIGFYTIEQEADEQQMETVTLLGLNPAQLVAWDIDFYKKSGEEYDENTGLDMQRCEELLRKNWIEDGKPVLVPVADYNGIHHSDCYRIFTTSREIAAHQWDKVSAPVPIQFLSDPEWKNLQDSLGSVEENPEEPGLRPHPEAEQETPDGTLVIKRIRFGFLEIIVKKFYDWQGRLIEIIGPEFRLLDFDGNSFAHDRCTLQHRRKVPSL